MMIKKFKFRGKSQAEDHSFISRLCDEKSFFNFFIPDLKHAKKEIVIESPFMARQRIKSLLPVLKGAVNRGVKVYVITRDPSILEKQSRNQSDQIIKNLEAIGIQVLASTNNHHRKLAIIDRKVLWEGSLNILSQTNSREIMRRIDSPYFSQEMFDFLKLDRFI